MVMPGLPTKTMCMMRTSDGDAANEPDERNDDVVDGDHYAYDGDDGHVVVDDDDEEEDDKDDDADDGGGDGVVVDDDDGDNDGSGDWHAGCVGGDSEYLPPRQW